MEEDPLKDTTEKRSARFRKIKLPVFEAKPVEVPKDKPEKKEKMHEDPLKDTSEKREVRQRPGRVVHSCDHSHTCALVWGERGRECGTDACVQQGPWVTSTGGRCGKCSWRERL